MKPFIISSNKIIKEKNKSRGKINLRKTQTLQVPPSKQVSQYSSPSERGIPGHLTDK